ncbi:MAG TPA: protein kinase, partial [Gemmataceae bacterium]|nr:protein kinase [Gemmataceae bacterium]
MPSPPTPERIGRYRVLVAIESGGMGRVYRAHDPQLDRFVAIKVPRLEVLRESPAVWAQRFLREAQSAARVRHPNVCPIYDVGEHDGTPFVVMAFIDGPSLAECLRGPSPYEQPAEAAQLVRQVAEGLGAVHDGGLIHRDIKPGNVLIDRDGQALLTDFGLARPEQDAEHLTASGVMVGTPAYMAPEQACGEVGRVGPWTDVYSLGVVLYRLLAGRLPFVGPTTAVLWKIGNELPPPPSEFRPGLDPALERVLRKAMALRPEERYATAREFAADLGAWLAAGGVGLQPGVDGRQVANLPHEEAVHSTPTQPYRLRPAAPAPPAKAPPPPRPRRFVAVAAALALVGVVALLAWWLLSPSAVGEAVGGALALARPTPGPADIEPEPLDLAPGAALSPKALVTRPASLKKDVRSWTVETREPRGVVHAVAYRPDGRQVALAGEDGMVRVLDTASGALVRLLVAHGGPVRGLDWSPNGRFLASAGEDGVVCLWGAEAGRLLRRLRGGSGPVYAVCWSPDGETLATGGEDGQVRFRRAADGKLLEGGVKHGGAVLALAWSPDGRLVASAGWEKWVRVWDVGSCQPLPPLDAHRPPSPVSALAWSPNSRTLATAGPDQQIRLWLAAEGKNERTIAAGASVTALAWARATGELAAGTQKGVAIYDRSGDPVRSHKMESGVVWALAWSPDGKKFVAANDDAVRTREANDRSVTLATCHPASRAATAHGPLGRASVAWSPDGRTLAVAGFSDRALRFWDGQTGAFRPEKADGPCESTLAWSPDGKSLAVAAGDTVRLWDETGHRWSGAELKCASDVLALAWSPDGKSLAAGLDGGEVWLWRDGQSHPLTPPAKRLGGVFAVVWSPDGQVVAGGTNGALLFWPAGGGKPSQVPVHAQVPIKAL